MEFTIDIDESKIEKAVQKTGKIDSWQMEAIVRDVIYKKVAAEVRKRIGKSQDEFIMQLVDEVDWQKIVTDIITQRLQESE